MSLLLLFNQSATAVAQELAAQSDDDLERLRAVVADASDSGASYAEFSERLNREVPRASRIAPLLQQCGTPLATWLIFILTFIMLVLAWRAVHSDKTMTCEQIDQIVQQVVQDVQRAEKDDQAKPAPEPEEPSARIDRGPVLP